MPTTTSTTASTQINKQYRLNYRDLLRGLLIAVGTAALTALIDILNVSGLSEINWKTIAAVSLSAGLSYIVKNFFTPTEIVVIHPPMQALTAVKEGAPIKVGTTTVAAKSNPAE